MIGHTFYSWGFYFMDIKQGQLETVENGNRKWKMEKKNGNSKNLNATVGLIKDHLYAKTT